MTIDQAQGTAPSVDARAQQSRPGGLVIEVGVHQRFGFRLVRLRGELDGATASDLALVLSGVLGDGVLAAVIDLAGLDFLDLTGARLIGTVSTLLRMRGGEVVLLAPNSAVARPLRVIGLEHLIHDGGDYTNVLSGFSIAESISFGAAGAKPGPINDGGVRARVRADARRQALIVRARRANANLRLT